MKRQFVVDTSDCRNEFLLQALISKGHLARRWNGESVQDCVLLLSTTTTPSADTKDSIVFCGDCDPIVVNHLKLKGVKVYKYFDDQILAVQNAELTAQGALAKVILNTKSSLSQTHALVLGSGRVARSVAKILYHNRCAVDIQARFDCEIHIAQLFCNNLFAFDTMLQYQNYDTLINTIPHRVFDDRLSLLNSDCYILDLASKPGGIDKDTAKRCGIHLENYLSVPTLTAPKTSSKQIMESVLRIIDKI